MSELIKKCERMINDLEYLTINPDIREDYNCLNSLIYAQTKLTDFISCILKDLD